MADTKLLTFILWFNLQSNACDPDYCHPFYGWRNYGWVDAQGHAATVYLSWDPSSWLYSSNHQSIQLICSISSGWNNFLSSSCLENSYLTFKTQVQCLLLCEAFSDPTPDSFICLVPRASCICLYYIAHQSILKWYEQCSFSPSNSKFYYHRVKFSYSLTSLTDTGKCCQWSGPFHICLDFTVRKFFVRVNHTAGLTNIHLLGGGSSWFYHLPLIEALQMLRTPVTCPKGRPWSCPVLSPAISYRTSYSLPSKHKELFPLTPYLSLVSWRRLWGPWKLGHSLGESPLNVLCPAQHVTHFVEYVGEWLVEVLNVIEKSGWWIIKDRFKGHLSENGSLRAKISSDTLNRIFFKCPVLLLH